MFGLYKTAKELHQKGVMGMNQRNINYISKYNDRKRFPLVDNKLKTKLIATKAGATVPNLIGIIEQQAKVKDVHVLLTKYANSSSNNEGFVIKPAQGSGGKGILVITSYKNGHYIKVSGEQITKIDLERHITNILAGLFSLGGKKDIALIECLIEFDNSFDGFSYEGIPDIRVIVFLGYPVMAMMRLSTKESDGKANLHQGAVGVGLNIATGRALHAVQFNRPVLAHPDTGRILNELIVPHWQELLELASSAWEMTKLGYIGTDIVLDKNLGHMILELNARPGLAIQIANGEGLLNRLRKVEMLDHEYTLPLKERVKWAMENL